MTHLSYRDCVASYFEVRSISCDPAATCTTARTTPVFFLGLAAFKIMERTCMYYVCLFVSYTCDRTSIHSLSTTTFEFFFFFSSITYTSCKQQYSKANRHGKTRGHVRHDPRSNRRRHGLYKVGNTTPPPPSPPRPKKKIERQISTANRE